MVVSLPGLGRRCLSFLLDQWRPRSCSAVSLDLIVHGSELACIEKLAKSFWFIIDQQNRTDICNELND
ncbi:hypothetical protein BpHYR1_018112 [Brachionus plicatilis]|uniref:Uncharacterized protein n=1 Tax=Brachionus plicatilis TaxID=10195 RepID=A0A3M7T200_BRAPC|nr:hypothetical protein BpHYR1_018112 [Brachionus plicatilis]